MKKLALLLLLLLLTAAGGYVAREHQWAYNDLPLTKNHAVTRQARTSHVLVFYNDSGDARKRCSGTAVGNHVLLTAFHCNENGLQHVHIDYSNKDYKILAVAKDDEDHVLYLIDGPAFFYIDPYKTRAPRTGERIFIYGFGGGAYPANYKTGAVVDEYDPSELSYTEGLFYTSLKVIPGDSGSAIYGADGDILGIVSYQITIPGFLFDKISSAEFELDSSKLNEKLLTPPAPAPVIAKSAFDLFGMKK